jgi:hypothetical protein
LIERVQVIAVRRFCKRIIFARKENFLAVLADVKSRAWIENFSIQARLLTLYKLL